MVVNSTSNIRSNIQKIYSKIYCTTFANAYHDVTTFEVHRVVQNVNISRAELDFFRKLNKL